MKIAKNILKKSREEDPYIALLAYRNTPQQGHVYSPAQRLMSRRLRDLIPMATSKLQPQLAVPSVVTQNIAERKQKAKAHYDKLRMLICERATVGTLCRVVGQDTEFSSASLHPEVQTGIEILNLYLVTFFQLNIASFVWKPARFEF